ncbi:MAG TPA: hypothetical protein VJ208_03995 [Candidatus Nanoarchaeia archaeon]|nr:hypothetical protein [Candidatus Nanoarchaeia archaeon]
MRFYFSGFGLLLSSFLAVSCMPASQKYFSQTGMEQSIVELQLGNPLNDIGGGKCGNFYSFIWRNQVKDEKVTGRLYYGIKDSAGFVGDRELEKLVESGEIYKVHEKTPFLFVPRETELGDSIELLIFNGKMEKRSTRLENPTACDALWESENMKKG